MRNFIIILFTLFILLLLAIIFIPDPLLFFLTVFLALIIVTICLFFYLGAFRGLAIVIVFIILPFLIDYLLAKYHFPLFDKPLIENLFTSTPSEMITLSNLYTVFTLPMIFMSALFFAQKIRLYSNIKNYLKTFIVLASSLLVALNFLSVKNNIFVYAPLVKWLLIALLINLLLARLYDFVPDALDIYKEIPIIIYLALYAVGALKRLDLVLLGVAGILTIYYLFILFNEYKIRKLSEKL